MFGRLFLIGCLAATAVVAQEAEEKEEEKIPDKNPFDTPADAAAGRPYFLGHCAACHGPEGEGGRGINLTTGRFRRGTSDRELFRTISKGVPGSEMPGVRLSQPEVWKVITFVRRLAAQGAEEKAPGDPAAGRAVYEGKGACTQCHWINGRGGVLGPDLSEIGLRRSLKFLRESVTDPDKTVAEDYRTYSVVNRSGERVRGVRLNEDDYSIQLRDSKENLRSFHKPGLKEVKREPGSMMPPYGTALTATELDNLVAYLSSLRGKAQ